MKLKKIASLMLAGVMAISMLAGCSTNGNGDDKGEEVVTGISADFASYLTNQDKVDFADNANDQAALAKAVKNVEDSTIKNVTTLADTALTAEPTKTVVSTLKANTSLILNQVNTNTVRNITEKTTYVVVYQAPGEMKQSAVLAQAASKIDTTVSGLPENSLKGSETAGTKYYTYDYTGSVSVEKVSTKNGESSAWYVLVSVTVDPTETKLPAQA